jgi:hypothetical protein
MRKEKTERKTYEINFRNNPTLISSYIKEALDCDGLTQLEQENFLKKKSSAITKHRYYFALLQQLKRQGIP